MKVIFITLLLYSTGALAAEQPSTLFSGLASVFAQDAVPAGMIQRQMGFEDPADPDWTAIEENLRSTQLSLATDLASNLEDLNACEASTWEQGRSEKLAKTLDRKAKKSYRTHYKQAKRELTTDQFSVVQSWIDSNRSNAMYIWLVDYDNPADVILPLCQRMREMEL